MTILPGPIEAPDDHWAATQCYCQAVNYPPCSWCTEPVDNQGGGDEPADDR